MHASSQSQFVLIVCMCVYRVCYSSLSQQQAYSGYMRQQYSYYVSCSYYSRCIRYTKTRILLCRNILSCDQQNLPLYLTLILDTHTDSSLGLSIGQLIILNAIAAQGTNRATANRAVWRAYRAVQAAAVS